MGETFNEQIMTETNLHHLHHAVMGCVVEDEQGKCYGITCEHVTRAADGVFHIENEFGKLEQVGRSMQFRKDKPFKHDIDMFELDEAVQSVVTAKYMDTKENSVPCRVYQNDIQKLYGKQIFHVQGFVEKESNSTVFGRICSAEVHKRFSHLINVKHNFLVEGQGAAFAQEGDSGRLVASRSEDGSLELLGITTAGKFRIDSGDVSQKRSLCLLLNSGLKMLRKFYKKKLCLRSSSLSLAEAEAKPKTGLVIWFKTPEQIKEPDFDLCEHLETLTTCFAVAETSDNVDLLLKFEVKMSNKVFSRDDVASDEYTYDQSDQICVFDSMLACQYLYEKRFNEAEEHLKTACRMIPKRSRFPVRLLCKVISYVTWLFLDMDKLDEMKLMLDAGLEFMEETKHFKSFPSESIGYQYYDYARYYLRKHQDQDAAQMAKRAVEYFMQENRDEDGSPNRQILAVSQFAMIKLGCGEEFDTYDQTINDGDIVEVEKFLGQLGAVANDQPSVQLTDYLLAVCDLNYRKGNIEKAIEAAQRCLKIAGEKGLEDEILWSRNRLKILSRLKTKMNMQDKRDVTRKQLDSK